MTSLEQQVKTACLSEKCKVDLLNHVEQINLQSAALSKHPCTVADQNLPSAALATTETFKFKIFPGVGEVTRQRYLHQKTHKKEIASSCAQALGDSTYSKKCTNTYYAQPIAHNPLQQSRSREKLSNKDEDFVYRYGAALANFPLVRPTKSDTASVSVAEAYSEAFFRYKGRKSTPKELEEADRLYFGFDEHGKIGVVQKPHACFPHSHISMCNLRPVKCANQVYKPELPPIRASRDRFPGPVPIWSSTKNTYMMTASDMHHFGHYNPHCSAKQAALKTVVGFKDAFEAIREHVYRVINEIDFENHIYSDVCDFY